MLLGMERPGLPGLRWTTEPQWHVTLRFLGEVADPGAVTSALASVPDVLAERGVSEVRAVLGPTTAWFPGRQVLQLPVTGLEALAQAVTEKTAPWDRHADARRFSGHLTLARARGRTRGPAHLAGAPLAVTWQVRALELVASTLGGDGAHYETLATVPLAGAASKDA